jgi:hypothetical protein
MKNNTGEQRLKRKDFNDALKIFCTLNEIPREVIEKLDTFYEVTPIKVGDNITVPPNEKAPYGAGVVMQFSDNNMVAVKHENGKTYYLPKGWIEHDWKRTPLPTHSTMWYFKNLSDFEWLENGGLDVMAECGFRIYKEDYFRYIFGVKENGQHYWKRFATLYRAKKPTASAS